CTSPRCVDQKIPPPGPSIVFLVGVVSVSGLQRKRPCPQYSFSSMAQLCMYENTSVSGLGKEQKTDDIGSRMEMALAHSSRRPNRRIIDRYHNCSFLEVRESEVHPSVPPSSLCTSSKVPGEGTYLALAPRSLFLPFILSNGGSLICGDAYPSCPRKPRRSRHFRLRSAVSGAALARNPPPTPVSNSR
ncbi:hypothetical protein CCUS01_02317, partial [Colletotrichum cuscutae]